jgi:hypothetical protein
LKPKTQVWLFAAALFALIAVMLFTRACSTGGAMGGWYQECTCRGAEKVVRDLTPADGPRYTICVGIVESKRCYRSRGGPEIPC